ncbi:MAG: VWA domain-containing protein, partial [Flavobacteriales bacterium]
VKEKALKINYKSNNIVFLLDVSTSMNSDGKLDLLKSSLIEMVNKLSENDTITLISYSTFSKVIVEGVSAKEKELLTNTIQAIKAQGMTAGGDGMKLAYRQGREHFIEGGNNQVIMATDGKFNKGNINLDRLVEKNFARGIGLTVLGIKNKPEDAESMEAIAKMGGGRFLLIENYEDSKELLISEIKRTSVVYSR